MVCLLFLSWGNFFCYELVAHLSIGAWVRAVHEFHGWRLAASDKSGHCKFATGGELLQSGVAAGGDGCSWGSRRAASGLAELLVSSAVPSWSADRFG